MKRLIGFGIPALLVLLALVAARASAAPRAALVQPTTVKILVDKDGWYRVPVSTLQGLGVDPTNANAHLQTGGQDVPYELTNANSNFEFYGQALDTVYTNTRVYLLTIGSSAGSRITTVGATGPTTPAPSGTFQATLVSKDRASLYTNVINGPGNNFFGQLAVTPTQSPSRPLTLSNVDTTASGGTLKVDLQGYLGFSHTVNVSLNGTPLGPVTGSGTSPMTATLTVPPNTLTSGTNTILLQNASAPGDAVLTDTFTLTYQHFFMADSDALDFIPPGSAFRVGGFSTTARVVDISNQAGGATVATRELTISQSGGTLGITPPSSPAPTRLYAFTDAKVLSPKQVLLDTPSDLKALTNKADLIVIAYKDFITPVQPLVTARVAEGLDVDVVDVQDVFDEFSFGAHTPDAIRDFLQYAKNNWQSPKPRYVLLVGDGSVDPRSFVFPGDRDYVPTIFVTSQFAPEPPSDDSLADFNNDGIPELAVGRLPVENASAASAMALKIVNYAGQAGSKAALLVSDNFDRNDYHFNLFSDDLRDTSLSPNGVTSTSVYRPDNATATTDGAAHTAVLNGANSGPTIVNWFGHGAETNWAGGPALLSRDDAPGLTNAGHLSLYLMMTCKNAYFVFPGFAGLGESLLLAQNGAMAVWGSSGDTVPGDQIVAAKTATNQLFSQPQTRLGDAMISAKTAVSDIDVRHTWTLLGDPTSRLRISGPTGVTLKSFTAVRAARTVKLRWQTANETEVAGFNVYRFAGGTKVKLNRALIAAKRTGTAAGHSYSLVDKRVRRGTAYTYRLQIVSLSGKRSWAATSVLRAAN